MDTEILSRCRSTHKMGEGISTGKQSPNRRSREHKNGERSSSKLGSGNPKGLQIVIHQCQRESNIVNKFMFMNRTTSPAPLSNFPKACHLCKKQLSPDQDVYMYRGDHGFCSVECRCKQMLMDEEKEMRQDYYRRLQCRRGHSRIGKSNRQGIPAMA